MQDHGAVTPYVVRKVTEDRCVENSTETQITAAHTILSRASVQQTINRLLQNRHFSGQGLSNFGKELWFSLVLFIYF